MLSGIPVHGLKKRAAAGGVASGSMGQGHLVDGQPLNLLRIKSLPAVLSMRGPCKACLARQAGQGQQGPQAERGDGRWCRSCHAGGGNAKEMMTPSANTGGLGVHGLNSAHVAAADGHARGA